MIIKKLNNQFLKLQDPPENHFSKQLPVNNEAETSENNTISIIRQIQLKK